MFSIFVVVRIEIVTFFAEVNHNQKMPPGGFKPNTKDDLIFTVILTYYLRSRDGTFPNA